MKALITGAASGIGRAVVYRLISDAAARSEQATLAIVDYAEEPLKALEAELNGMVGVSVVAVAADLSQPDAITDAVERSLDFTVGLDTLVSNAGVISPSPLRDLKLASWDRDFAVNTRATWLLAQAAFDALSDGGGSIVTTSSLSAFEATADMGAYSPSKAAVVMLCKQLAREWGQFGIRCNSVSPGAVVTGMTSAVYADKEATAKRSAQIPLGRVAQPEDIAAAISFLAGPDAAYVTGVNIPVDGGWGIALMPKASASGTV